MHVYAFVSVVFECLFDGKNVQDIWTLGNKENRIQIPVVCYLNFNVVKVPKRMWKLVKEQKMHEKR